MIEESALLDIKQVVLLGDILKIPLIFVLLGGLFFAFLLSLKVRILIDTVDSENNSKIKMLVYINLLISLFFSIIGVVIIVSA